MAYLNVQVTHRASLKHLGMTVGGFSEDLTGEAKSDHEQEGLETRPRIPRRNRR